MKHGQFKVYICATHVMDTDAYVYWTIILARHLLNTIFRPHTTSTASADIERAGMFQFVYLKANFRE